MNYRFKKKIIYLIKARHHRGHGIHSPFLFRLITEVFENRGNFSAYPLLKSAAENVRNMLRILDMTAYSQPAVSKASFSCAEVKAMHRLPEKFDRLLFRLVNDFKPEQITFYGSTFGVTLLALALADSRIVVEAQVENHHYRSFCRRLTEVYEIRNICLKPVGRVVASGFNVIQDPMDPVACDKILAHMLADSSFEGVIVLCNIHASPEMEEVWTHYRKDSVVRVSLDLFELGLLICRKELQKEAFVVRF